MLKTLIKLLTKTYTKVIFKEEYYSPIKYGYTPEHKVKSEIVIERIFDFAGGWRYCVTASNFSCTSKSKTKALLRVLENQSIGMAKYNRLKDDLYSQNLYQKLNPR